ncbi:MAG TPA: GMC family oxidoreductase [Gemmatimonadaceae bacterium]|nr:GMC family oxidoreductase [Gemmatimonadaceae bacterium]
MHTDARTLANGTVLEGDLCIVGAGASGITIAREFAKTPLKVLLLEGGGFELEQQIQDLYRGEIIGHSYFPLQGAALHFFGGTTNHWAGFCSPYDEIDFEKRDWVPHSGWPIRRQDLDPFYARAQKILELGPYKYEPDDWKKGDENRVPLLGDSRDFNTKMWQFSPPTRFGTKYRNEIVGSPNIHLYTYANVVEVEANEGLTAVRSVRVRGFDGKELRAQAKRFVLCCHSIQNARLLLASNRQARTGLGNGNDLVGRYFMEHFEMPTAELVLARPATTRTGLYAMAGLGGRPRGELAITPAAQKEHRVLHGTASLAPGNYGDPVKSTFEFLDTATMNAMRAWQTGGRKGPPPFVEAAAPPTASGPPRFYHLTTRQEQAPNPDSRVTLSGEKDALGMARARLDWQFTDLDKRSMRTFYELLGREMGRTGTGRVQIKDWLLSDDKTWPSFVSGGFHHMGTTRMSDDPKQGVVDANCQVHGLANLHIGGAAVYPTAGAVNPTLTLVALSLRLADRLKANAPSGALAEGCQGDVLQFRSLGDGS